MIVPYMMNDNFYRPPLLSDLMNSKLNFDNENPISYRNMANSFRQFMFDFDYPLSNKITKEDFECQIINHFFMRRIGQQTFLAFKMRLENKLNEIMPYYNKIFDSYTDWDIFANGETEIETIADSKTYNENGTNATTTDKDVTNTNTTQTSTNSSTSTTSDRRYSKTPQNELSNIRDGKYVTDYNYDQNAGIDSATSNGTSSNTTQDDTTINGSHSKTGNESLSHTRNNQRINNNKMDLYKQFIEETRKIMSLIYNDLECLFYGLEEF